MDVHWSRKKVSLFLLISNKHSITVKGRNIGRKRKMESHDEENKSASGREKSGWMGESLENDEA